MAAGSPELVLQHFVEQIGAEESNRLALCSATAGQRNEPVISVVVRPAAVQHRDARRGASAASGNDVQRKRRPALGW